MKHRAATHQFASTWLARFEAHHATNTLTTLAPQLKEALVTSPFKMDAYARVKYMYPAAPALNTLAGLTAFAEYIDDALSLGNLIYSQYEWVSQWAWGGLETEDNYQWFVLALARLEVLSRPLGPLAAFTLTSVATDSPNQPLPAAAGTQTLKLTPNAATLTSQPSGGNPRLETAAPGSEAMAALLLRLSQYFDDYQDQLVPGDGWTAEVYTTGGQTRRFYGPLSWTPAQRLLSDAVRLVVRLPHLWLFDRDPDVLVALNVQYGEAEVLTLKRDQAAISYVSETAATSAALTVTGSAVPALLDELTFAFDRPQPPQPQADLVVNATFRYSGMKTLRGNLALADQLTNWPTIAYKIGQVLAANTPLMLDSRVFTRHRPALEDLLYCQVLFHHDGQAYSYRTSDTSLAVGDRVLVPVGTNRTVGTIVAMDYYAKDRVPYPLSKTKEVLGLATPRDWFIHDEEEDDDDD
ncbi:hypothetical protein [Lacticaseibacillus suihuaensis]